MANPNSPEFDDREMQEKAVAEELGVEPEKLELPPGIRRGVTLFELDDGSFGFIPASEDLTLMDAYVLAQRLVMGATADLVAQKVVARQTEKAQQLARQVQSQKRPPSIVIPGRKNQ